MVGKNNKKVQLNKAGDSFKRYTLRKLSVGVASVAIASGVMFGASQSVSAEELSAPATGAVVENDVDVVDEEEIITVPELDETEAQGTALLDDDAQEDAVINDVVEEDEVFENSNSENTDLSVDLEDESLIADPEETDTEIEIELSSDNDETNEVTQTAEQTVVVDEEPSISDSEEPLTEIESEPSSDNDATIIALQSTEERVDEDDEQIETIYRANSGLPFGEELVIDDGAVSGERYVEKANVERESTVVDYYTEYVTDENLDYGQRRIVQEGVRGSQDLISIYSVDMYTGELTKVYDSLVDLNSIVRPVNEIVAIGNQLTEVISHGYETIYRANPDLAYGANVVVREGQEGRTQITQIFDVDSEGNLVLASQSSQVLQEAQDQIIERGNVRSRLRNVPFYNEYVTASEYGIEVPFGETLVAVEGNRGQYYELTTFEVDPETGELVNPSEPVVNPETRVEAQNRIHVIGNVETDVAETEYATVYRANSDLNYGAREVVQEGRNEAANVVRTYELNDQRQLVNPTEVRTVVTEGQNQIIERGNVRRRFQAEPFFNEYVTASEYGIEVPFGETVVAVEGNRGQYYEVTTYEVDAETGELVNPSEPVVDPETVVPAQNRIHVIGNVSTQEEAIAYETIYSSEPSLEFGEQSIVREGQEGVARVETTYELDDQRNLVNASETSRVVLQTPVDEFISVGNIERETTVVDYYTEYVTDENLDYGQRQIVQEGVRGSQDLISIYTVDSSTGELTRVYGGLVDLNSIVRPVNEIIAVGNQQTEVISQDYGTVYRANPELDYGANVVVREGQEGRTLITRIYDVDSEGNLVFASQSSQVIQEAQDQIIERGNVRSRYRAIPFTNEYRTASEHGIEVPFGETVVAVEGHSGSYYEITEYEVDPETGELVNPGETTVDPETRIEAQNRINVIGNVETDVAETEYATIYRANPELNYGAREVVQEGRNEVANIVRTYELNDQRQLVNPTEVRTVVTEGQNQIIERGNVRSRFQAEPFFNEYVTASEYGIEVPFGETIVAVEGNRGQYYEITEYEVDPETGNLVNPSEPVVDPETVVPAQNRIHVIGNVTTQEEPIAYETFYSPEALLEFGEQSIDRPGQEGLARVEVIYELDDQQNLVNPSETRQVLENPVNELISVGNVERILTEIPYETVYVVNPELAPSESVVRQEGIVGIENRGIRNLYTVDQNTGELSLLLGNLADPVAGRPAQNEIIEVALPTINPFTDEEIRPSGTGIPGQHVALRHFRNPEDLSRSTLHYLEVDENGNWALESPSRLYRVEAGQILQVTHDFRVDGRVNELEESAVRIVIESSLLDAPTIQEFSAHTHLITVGGNAPSSTVHLSFQDGTELVQEANGVGNANFYITADRNDQLTEDVTLNVGDTVQAYYVSEGRQSEVAEFTVPDAYEITGLTVNTVGDTATWIAPPAVSNTISGTVNPNAFVTVHFNNGSANAPVAADGTWSVANPGRANSGDAVNITVALNSNSYRFFNVYTVAHTDQVTTTDAIPYEVEETQSDQLYVTERQVVQEGQAGTLSTSNFYLTDGQGNHLVSEPYNTTSEVAVAPVNEIVLVGTMTGYPSFVVREFGSNNIGENEPIDGFTLENRAQIKPEDIQYTFSHRYYRSGIQQEGLPEGLTYDASTHTVTGTPVFEWPSPQSRVMSIYITIEAENTAVQANTHTNRVTITINREPEAPSVQAPVVDTPVYAVNRRVYGTAQPGTTIHGQNLRTGRQTRTVTNEAGDWRSSTNVLNAAEIGDIVEFYAEDANGNVSEVVSITLEVSPIARSTINPMTSDERIVTGTGTPGTQVEVHHFQNPETNPTRSTVRYIPVPEDGNWSLGLYRVAEGQIVTAQTILPEENNASSEVVSITITAPTVPTEAGVSEELPTYSDLPVDSIVATDAGRLQLRLPQDSDGDGYVDAYNTMIQVILPDGTDSSQSVPFHGRVNFQQGEVFDGDVIEIYTTATIDGTPVRSEAEFVTLDLPNRPSRPAERQEVNLGSMRFAFVPTSSSSRISYNTAPYYSVELTYPDGSTALSVADSGGTAHFPNFEGAEAGRELSVRIFNRRGELISLTDPSLFSESALGLNSAATAYAR